MLQNKQGNELDRIASEKYAPGFSSYGRDGLNGKDGEQGTALFNTPYCLYINPEHISINEQDEEQSSRYPDRFKVIYLINENKRIDGSNEEEARKYMQGDIIIDSTGTFYRIERSSSNSDKLSVSKVNYGRIDLNDLLMIEQKKEFDIDTISELKKNGISDAIINDLKIIFHNSENNRAVLNQSYSGIDIITHSNKARAKALQHSFTNAPERIITDRSMKNEHGHDIYPFKSFIVDTTKEGTEKTLDMYYNAYLDAWVFDSTSNIILESNGVYISDNAQSDFNSSVLNETYTPLKREDFYDKSKIYKEIFNWKVLKGILEKYPIHETPSESSLELIINSTNALIDHFKAIMEKYDYPELNGIIHLNVLANNRLSQKPPKNNYEREIYRLMWNREADDSNPFIQGNQYYIGRVIFDRSISNINHLNKTSASYFNRTPYNTLPNSSNHINTILIDTFFRIFESIHFFFRQRLLLANDIYTHSEQKEFNQLYPSESDLERSKEIINALQMKVYGDTLPKYNTILDMISLSVIDDTEIVLL